MTPELKLIGIYILGVIITHMIGMLATEMPVRDWFRYGKEYWFTISYAWPILLPFTFMYWLLNKFYDIIVDK